MESFHPAVVRWWRKNHPEVVRGQLAMGASGYEMNGAIRFVLSRLLANCAGRPHFIAYEYRAAGFSVRMCRLLGAMPVAWTVKTPDDAPSAEKNYDMVIFEGYTPDPIYKTNKQR